VLRTLELCRAVVLLPISAAKEMGRAEEGIERVVRRVAVARLGRDLGISANDSIHKCARRVPLCSRAAAVMHGVVDTPSSAVCMLLGHMQLQPC
jgi:hypothetical protein